MSALPCIMIRGGSSRGAYFDKAHLPDDVQARNAILLRVMGGPDALQVDGVGGGHPLTSKVAIINVSSDPDADVDYLFLQVDPERQTVSDKQNCGNILAGVGLYAIEEGLVEISDPLTTVRVRMLNSGALCHLEVPSPGGAVALEGDTVIDGVPGSAPAIICNYLDIAGSTCGSLLPTGNVVDEIDGVGVTCVDNGMPVVVLAADDMGVTGAETPEELDANKALKQRLESVRLQLGARMNLGDVAKASVPKMCLVSRATNGGLISTRTFIPHTCHKSIGVLGAVSVATACVLPGSIAATIAKVPEGNPKIVSVEHPAGALSVSLNFDDEGSVNQAGVVRTGRILFKGSVYV